MNAENHPEVPSDAPCSDSLRRVLLVDAEPHVLQVMKSTLDRSGFEVDTALNAATAKELFEEYGHHVIVIDGDDLDSLAVPLCDELARLPEDLRPLTLWASGNDVIEADVMSKLACESLAKPLSLRYLVARLAGHFGCYATHPNTN